MSVREERKRVSNRSQDVNSEKIHLAKALSDGFEYRVIVFSSEEKAKQAYEEWRVLEENVWFYPARDLLFYHADIKDAF